MSNYDLLLDYLSTLRAGTWQSFRTALQYVTEEPLTHPSVTAANLSALGHMEFAFEDDLRWTIAPPAVAWLPQEGRLMGVLCGRRWPTLLADLQAAVEVKGGAVHWAAQPLGPTAIYLEVPSTVAGERVADQVGLTIVPEAARRLAACLPPLASYRTLLTLAPPPVGFPCRRYDLTRLKWQPVERAEGPGLYHYDSYRPEYRLREGDHWWRVPRALGIYLLLQSQRQLALDYSDQTRHLRVPRGTPLPFLQARALTLASGQLPQFVAASRAWVYQDVPPDLAHLVRRSLDQQAKDTRDAP